mgnify:CR=1 FL=1
MEIYLFLTFDKLVTLRMDPDVAEAFGFTAKFSFRNNNELMMMMMMMMMMVMESKGYVKMIKVKVMMMMEMNSKGRVNIELMLNRIL